MIHERRRLIPTMIAVIIGVTFVASTLMLMDSIKAATLRTQAAAVGDATAVVTAKEPSKPISPTTTDKINGTHLSDAFVLELAALATPPPGSSPTSDGTSPP